MDEVLSVSQWQCPVYLQRHCSEREVIFTWCQHFYKAWLLKNNGHFGNCQFSSRVNCNRVGGVWFAEAVISWAPISIRATLLTSLQRWADNSAVLWLTHKIHLPAFLIHSRVQLWYLVYSEWRWELNQRALQPHVIYYLLSVIWSYSLGFI